MRTNTSHIDGVDNRIVDAIGNLIIDTTPEYPICGASKDDFEKEE